MTNLSNPQTDPKSLIKVISIIHLAIITGPSLFFGVTLLLTKSYKFNLDYAADPLIIVVLLLTISSFILSRLLYKQQLLKASSQPTLKDKLTQYQTALIIKLALLEGAALFAVVAFFLSGNLFFAGMFGLIILALIASRPTRDNIETDLNLSYEEKMEIN